MSRLLNDLDFRFKNVAMEFLARCCEAGIPVMIIDTRRTPEEHAVNLAKGVSWTQRSKHLDGLAIDVCPYAIYHLAGGPDKLQWDSNHPVWRQIGAIGEALQLRWGGRWKQRDCSHFEYVALGDRPKTA